MKAEHKKQLHRLTKENRRIIRKMNRYLSARFLNTVLCRELIFDQIGMALESQKRDGAGTILSCTGTNHTPPFFYGNFMDAPA